MLLGCITAAVLPKQARGTFRTHFTIHFSQPYAPDCSVTVFILLHSHQVRGLLSSGNRYHMLYLFAFCLFVFFVLWLIIWGDSICYNLQSPPSSRIPTFGGVVFLLCSRRKNCILTALQENKHSVEHKSLTKRRYPGRWWTLYNLESPHFVGTVLFQIFKVWTYPFLICGAFSWKQYEFSSLRVF